jgi:hypothetical protein
MKYPDISAFPNISALTADMKLSAVTGFFTFALSVRKA